MMEKTTTKRLASLDVLRGLDLFCLVAVAPVIYAMKTPVEGEWFRWVSGWVFDHGAWAGFTPWDLVMPLFMFMSGVSMPFSLGKYREVTQSRWPAYKRIFIRVLLLWIFGMMCQGNLLGLDPDRIFFFSNTLQAIAVGYLFTALLFLNTKPGVQIAVAAALLILYWALMQFVSLDGFGAGDYTPDGNLAEGIDRAVLGRFRDGASVENGVVIFSQRYRYTWILSSLNFVVTVMTGLFAGYILRDKNRGENRKTLLLVGLGAAMTAAGWLWGLQMPVIKKIWTSSMTLVSSGYCFILMGLFYWWIDVRGHDKYTDLMKIYGMNSIMAYMLAMVVNFGSIGRSIFYGLEQYLGGWYGVLIALSNVAIAFIILYWMYRKKVYLRV